MRSLLQDLRFGFRVAFKNPGFTVVAVLTLAVGIAANTTVFSWIDTVLLHPIPGAAKGRPLVAFETLTPDGEAITNSYPDYRDFRDHLKLVSGLAAESTDVLSVGEGDHAERVWGELVSGNYFAVLGVQPALGRVFSPDEYGDRPAGYPVVVISYGLWQRRFNGDRGVIGQPIRVNQQQLTIVGVAPPEFHGIVTGLSYEMWMPFVMAPQLNIVPDWWMRDRKARNLRGIAALRPEVTVEQARAEVMALAHELGRMYPAQNGGLSATLLPLWKAHFGGQSVLLKPLEILMAVCLVVLLIVCSNVANLLLARATARQREFGLRLALGAGRGRLVRQLLTESLTLALLSALAAVPLSMWTSQSLQYLVPQSGGLPVALGVHMNFEILAFAILLCVAACVASGTAPAWHTARTDLNDVLKTGGRSGSAGARSERLRGLLVGSEVALALVALIGAGLFARSFQLARQLNPGFDPRNVLVSYLSLRSAGYTVPQQKQFCLRLRQRLESQPGVMAVTYADSIPLGFDGGSWEDLEIEGYVPGRSENLKIYRNAVAPGYFDLMKIPLVDGRDFTEHDDEQSRKVMIVSEAFVRHFFAGRYPIGRRVRGWGEWFTVVGVAKDSKVHTPNEAPQSYFYVPFRQVYRTDRPITYYIRSAGDPNQAVALLRREVHSLDPGATVVYPMPLADSMEASVFPQKVAASMLAALGGLALVLAAVGLYSVMSYTITQRTQEIGIRMALGAQPAHVLGMVVRGGMALTAAGVGVGIAAAAVVTRLASPLLVNVSATDPVIFGGAALFLAAVALAASYLPARRATRIDPNVALRCE